MNEVLDIKTWKNFFSINNDFSVKAPEDWAVAFPTRNAHIFQVISPDKLTVVSLSAFGHKPGSTVRDFANYRYSCVDRMYEPVGEEFALSNGFYRVFQDIVSNKEDKTDYLISGIQAGSIVVSVGVVTSYGAVNKNRTFFEAILLSVKESAKQKR